MRKVKINDDLIVEITPLTRKQIKQLKAEGFDVSSASIQNVDNNIWDEFIDRLVKTYLPSKAAVVLCALDDLPNDKYRGVTIELISETWGSRLEEKNS